jgi:hypothetical protein
MNILYLYTAGLLKGLRSGNIFIVAKEFTRITFSPLSKEITTMNFSSNQGFEDILYKQIIS